MLKEEKETVAKFFQGCIKLNIPPPPQKNHAFSLLHKIKWRRGKKGRGREKRRQKGREWVIRKGKGKENQNV